MANGIFPSKEDLFFIYVKAVIAYLIANATRFGITTARQTTLNTLLSTYTTAYNKASVKETRTKNDISARNTAHDALEAELRDVYSGLADSILTDIDRNTLNLKKPATRTSAPVPSTQPIAKIGTAIRLQHLIEFWDVATPNSRARPVGVRGCEIWYFIGATAPADVKQYRFLAVDSESPYIATFDGTDAGKSVWYILRWTNTRNQTGPWSAPVMATITA